MDPVPMESALRGTPDHVVLPLSGRILDHSHIDMAAKIIEVIYRYQNKRAGSEGIESDIGLLAGLAQAYSHVKANQPIKMCLPAFPFKSPNTKVKVLGRVPDKAEEFALAHLNGLCAAIKDVYSPGAELTIISDGIVYNGKYLLFDQISSGSGLRYVIFRPLERLRLGRLEIRRDSSKLGEDKGL